MMASHPTHARLLEPLRADLQQWDAAAERSVSLADTDAVYAKIPPYARARFVLSQGKLWKAQARCVYRRDEVTAWALVQLLERYPNLPDFDVVLNCRDGPLLPKPRNQDRKGVPLVLSYSATPKQAEVAFPVTARLCPPPLPARCTAYLAADLVLIRHSQDYTFWGLPGKLKPWAQLRVDLLHRAHRPWDARMPTAIATGVVNAYHNSLGVRARQAMLKCTQGEHADTRLDVRYHELYFQRYYSTEEHCAHKYILLAPGSHAVGLATRPSPPGPRHPALACCSLRQCPARHAV